MAKRRWGWWQTTTSPGTIGLHANCRTKYLSAEEVQYITWEMNARYYDFEWFRYNKVKKLYPRWFAEEIRRLAPFYPMRKVELGMGKRTPKDFFREDLESWGGYARELLRSIKMDKILANSRPQRPAPSATALFPMRSRVEV